MTPEQFKEKVLAYYAMVLDGQISKDDAEDAILDTITAVHEDQRDDAHDLHEKAWYETFNK